MKTINQQIQAVLEAKKDAERKFIKLEKEDPETASYIKETIEGLTETIETLRTVASLKKLIQ